MNNFIIPRLKELLKFIDEVKRKSASEENSNLYRDVDNLINRVDMIMALSDAAVINIRDRNRKAQSFSRPEETLEILNEINTLIISQLYIMENEESQVFISRRISLQTLDSDLIAKLHEILAELMQRLQNSNSLKRENSPLDDLSRRAVIGLLEATIATLKSPATDSGLLKRTQQEINEVGAKLRKSQMEGVALHLIEKASDIIKSIIG